MEAPNGATALARLEAGALDLVLTDLAMPGVSGWQVASACRERYPEMPVGLITGFGDQLEAEKLERHGIQFVVAKPFASEELLRVVANALKGPEARPRLASTPPGSTSAARSGGGPSPGSRSSPCRTSAGCDSWSRRRRAGRSRNQRTLGRRSDPQT